MKFNVTRDAFALYGITGRINSDDGELSLVTLEHAYLEDGAWVPKLSPGTYTFVPYDSPHLGYRVWALFNAPPFQGCPVEMIEIHVGNYNNDSIGCTLLGLKVGTGMIEDSQKAFDQFMDYTQGQESIEITYT